MKTTRISLTLLAILGISILLSAGCGSKEKDAAPEVPSLAIRVQAATNRVFERRLTVQGTLESKNYVQVAARTEGTLESIWVDEGDAVVAGKTPLFQVDPTQNQEALIIAQQNLAVTKASLAVAKASATKVQAEAKKATLDYERYTRLHKDGRVTDNEFETRDVLYEQAKAGVEVAAAQVDLAERQVKQAKAGVAIAQKNFDDTRIIAPLTGQVSSRSVEPGEHMSVGQVLLRIDDLSVVEASAFLPAQYYPEVLPNKTQFRLGVGGQQAGIHTVSYRSPIINPTLRTFEIKGRVEAQEGLSVPGSMANLTLVFDTRKGLGVASSSILVRNEKSIVFVVKDGKAVSHEVQTGLQNNGWTEVLSGLDAQMPVVTEGQTQLRDGMPVDIL